LLRFPRARVPHEPGVHSGSRLATLIEGVHGAPSKPLAKMRSSRTCSACAVVVRASGRSAAVIAPF
jgi:hypothetical protein